MSVEMTADAPVGIAETRRDQMFPALTACDIARIRRFGSVQHYARGDCLFSAGEPGPGMFVVLEGTVAITQRDGLGRVVPIGHQGPRPVPRRNRAALRAALPWSTAMREEDVETLLVPPEQLRALIIAEADLGERLVRAHDPAPRGADRIGQQRAGADRPAAIAPTCCGLQNFLRRNGHPYQVVDATQDSDAARPAGAVSRARNCWSSAPTARC